MRVKTGGDPEHHYLLCHVHANIIIRWRKVEILTVEIKSSVVFADENFGGGGRGGGTFWVGEAAAVILSAITVTS